MAHFVAHSIFPLISEFWTIFTKIFTLFALFLRDYRSARVKAINDCGKRFLQKSQRSTNEVPYFLKHVDNHCRIENRVFREIKEPVLSARLHN